MLFFSFHYSINTMTVVVVTGVSFKKREFPENIVSSIINENPN